MFLFLKVGLHNIFNFLKYFCNLFTPFFCRFTTC